MSRAAREVTQTHLAGDPSGIPGNCTQAAVASLLGLDLNEVPHFILIDAWLEYLVTWAALRGWTILRYNPDRPTVFGLASGPSERGVQHMVVMVDGEIAWDPHPSRAGLLRVTDVWEFTRADPASARQQLLLDEAPALYAEWGVDNIRTPTTPECRDCLDTGHVCEDHPDSPWEGIHGPTAFHAECGGMGIPCPACCDPIPADGTGSIGDAFTPRHLR